ncbi:lumican [Ictalurus furcatus]|uniref:lumican n=1 Tax=Ictalurus furcatus TaxID=66913 RepID=UPI002350389B|nr:lumican [Ictalurus furcatus]
MLTTVPTDALNDTSNLMSLYLQKNAIMSVPENAFNGLSALRKLCLSNNRIELNLSSFATMRKLKDLDLSNNNLTKISKGILHKPPLQLHDVQDQASQGGPELSKLNLSNNKIRVIDKHVFENYSNLNKLCLSNNHLKNLEEGTFRGALDLTHLDLSENRLTSVPTGALKDTPNLTSLFLQKNAITFVPENAFSGLSALKKLDLSNNYIVHLNEKSLKSLFNLVELDLSFNQLRTLKSVLQDLEKLKILKLHQNYLSSLPNGVFNNLTELTELRLDSNNLFDILPDLFHPPTELRDLDKDRHNISGFNSSSCTTLTNNLLTKNYKDLFNVTPTTNDNVKYLASLTDAELRELLVSNAEMTDMNCTNTIMRFLFNNHLKSTEKGTFKHTFRLSDLDLSKNKLTTIPSGALKSIPPID